MLEDITYQKRDDYVVECKNCSYKIVFIDEPCAGDDVECNNCKSKYIITDE